MALRTNEVLELGAASSVGASVGITGGPNDWDLWLCLRGNYITVTFYVDQPIRVLTCDSTTFFRGAITLMERKKGEYSDGRSEWHIEGSVYKGYMRSGVSFRATYNIESRKGTVEFF